MFRVGTAFGMWFIYAVLGGWLFTCAAMADDSVTPINSAPALATEIYSIPASATSTAPVAQTWFRVVPAPTTGILSTPVSITFPAPAPTPAPTSATATAVQALGAMHDKILKYDCRGHFDYGAKLLRLSASKLRGVCILLPANAFLRADDVISIRRFIAYLSYPVQQIAGVRERDSIAVNEARIERTIKKYGLIQLQEGLNTLDQTGNHRRLFIGDSIAAKPIVIQTDYDMSLSNAMTMGMGGASMTPAIFIVIGTQSLITGDGRVMRVPVLRLLGSPESRHVTYSQDSNLFPS